MVQVNFARRQVNCKIVYYGPGMSGKTTNLEMVYEKAPEKSKGQLTSIATEGDRTLFFDFLPLNLGNVAGLQTKFQLYTVPGQVYYNSTRKLVLRGADGVIFVADSQKKMISENRKSLINLAENLAEYDIDIREIPVVLQWNKRDMPDVSPVEVLEKKLNPLKWPSFEAVAVKGEGVFPTLKALSALVLKNLNKEFGGAENPAPAGKNPAPAPDSRESQEGLSRRQAPASRKSQEGLSRHRDGLPRRADRQNDQPRSHADRDPGSGVQDQVEGENRRVMGRTL
ncbi:MAG: GTP-binding protein [Planctomycetota bacterium]|jgi:signal recognition particle receptor subunit beta